VERFQKYGIEQSQKKQRLLEEHAKMEDNLLRSLFKPKINHNYKSKDHSFTNQTRYNYYSNQSNFRPKPPKIEIDTKDDEYEGCEGEKQSDIETATLNIKDIVKGENFSKYQSNQSHSFKPSKEEQFAMIDAEDSDNFDFI